MWRKTQNRRGAAVIGRAAAAAPLRMAISEGAPIGASLPGQRCRANRPHDRGAG